MATASRAPLAGKRVVVTRAPEQAEELIRQLHQLGADVLLFPAVSFVDPADSEALDAALDSLPQFHWLLFTSQNAVRFFTKRRRARGGGATAGQPLIAAVGPATAAAAERQGFRVEYVAGRFRGAALAEELGPRLAGKKILLPRSDLASGDLPAALRAAGADVTDVVAYRTVAPDGHDRSTAEAVSRGVVDVVTFLSPSALRHVAEEVGVEALRRVALAAIGPVTAAAIRDAGLAVEIEAREATAASLVTAIADYFTERLPSGVKSP